MEGGLGLHDHDAEAVRDDVVELAGDAGALGGDELGGLEVALAFEEVRALGEESEVATVGTVALAEEPGAGEDDVHEGEAAPLELCGGGGVDREEPEREGGEGQCARERPAVCGGGEDGDERDHLKGGERDVAQRLVGIREGEDGDGRRQWGAAAEEEGEAHEGVEEVGEGVGAEVDAGVLEGRSSPARSRAARSTSPGPRNRFDQAGGSAGSLGRMCRRYLARGGVRSSLRMIALASVRRSTT